jgi:hypothetical protein
MSQIQSKHLFALGVLLTALSIAISGFASASEETNVPQLIINDGKQDQLIEDEKATAESLKKNVSQNATSQKQPKYPANKDKSKQDSQKRHTKKQH